MSSPATITKESEIYDWFVQNMTPVTDGPTYEYQSKQWTQRFGFRYAFNMFGFFRSEDDQWALDIREYPSETFNPNMGIYPSYEAMLSGLTRRYAELWKISSS